jgi:hypothetical protein
MSRLIILLLILTACVPSVYEKAASCGDTIVYQEFADSYWKIETSECVATITFDYSDDETLALLLGGSSMECPYNSENTDVLFEPWLQFNDCTGDLANALRTIQETTGGGA